MGYRIKVIKEDCIGAGACVDEAPSSFTFDPMDKAELITPPGDEQEVILCAAQSCPAQAIVVIDEETGEQVWPEE